jgi:hypothetical protein
LGSRGESHKLQAPATFEARARSFLIEARERFASET